MVKLETQLIYGFSYRDITDIIDYDHIRNLMVEEICAIVESCEKNYVESAIERILKESPGLIHPLDFDGSMLSIAMVMDSMFPEKEFNATQEIMDFSSYHADSLFNVYKPWYTEIIFANDKGDLTDFVFGMNYKDKLIIESEGGISLHECYSDFFYEIGHLFKKELYLEDFIDRMKLYSCTIEQDEDNYIYPPINYKISVIE